MKKWGGTLERECSGGNGGGLEARRNDSSSGDGTGTSSEHYDKKIGWTREKKRVIVLLLVSDDGRSLKRFGEKERAEQLSVDERSKAFPTVKR